MKKIISLLVVVAMMLSLAGCGNSAYKEGMEALEAGDYLKAIELLSEKPDYKDAAEKIVEAKKAQLEIYAEIANVADAQALLTGVLPEELENYIPVLKTLVGNGIKASFNGDYSGYLDVCDYCYYILDFYSLIGLANTQEVETIFDVIGIYDSVEYHNVFLKWYPSSIQTIDSYLKEINAVTQMQNLYDPGLKLYEYADGLLNNYAVDSLSAKILFNLRSMGESTMNASKAKSEAEFNQNVTAANTYFNEFKKDVNAAVSQTAKIQTVLEELNSAFDLSIKW